MTGTPPPVSPCVSVVVVTHNHAGQIGACLESLRRAAAELPLEIIVIDNRSDDASARIAAGFAEVSVTVNTGRRGFAANVNAGLARARGAYLLALNPDTEVLPGALPALTAFMEAHPRVGLCGPQLVYPDGAPQSSARRFPTAAVALARRSPLRGLLRRSPVNRAHLMEDVDLSIPRPVDWLLGACLFIRRAALDAVGPFDEGYPLYVEDIDLARRLWAADWSVYFVPHARIVHAHQGASDKRLLSRAAWWHLRSMGRYVRKYRWPRALPGAIRGEIRTVWDHERRADTAQRDA